MKRLYTLLVAATLLFDAPHAGAEVFNLRASLADGYFVSGTTTVDTATGTVTAVDAVLSRYGVSLTPLGLSPFQGAFAPGGLASSYIFQSNGSSGYSFVAGIPTTSLVGYHGSTLCSFNSAVRCAFSDLFLGGSTIANAIDGVLAPVSDRIETFQLTASFANGYNAVGTYVIDTTFGFVLDEHVTLSSGGAVVDEFFNPVSQSLFAPGGLQPSLILGGLGVNGTVLNVAIRDLSLVGYGGGLICAIATAQDCALSDIFLSGIRESDAVTGRLSRVQSVDEPGLFALLVIGLFAARRTARTAVAAGRVPTPARSSPEDFR